MNKLFYSTLGIVLILIGVSAFLWFSRPSHITDTQPNRQTDEKKKRTDNNNPPQPSTVLPQTNETFETQVMDKFRTFFSEEQLANSEVQRILKILESPEGQAFLKSEINGLADTLAFFESQGVKVNRNIFRERYRKFFPTGEPEEFEDEIRGRLVEIVGSAEVESRNPADVKRFTDLVTEFLKDERNHAWVFGKFQGNNNAFGKWVVQTLRNPLPSSVEQTPETFVSEIEIPPDTRGTTDSQDPAAFSTDEAELSPKPPALDGDLPTTETKILEQVTEQPIKIDGEKLIPELQLPTEAELEASLREQFNPERFQKAMSTLNRYGPEEGLRRLKSDDPEIAKRIEPLLKRKENTQ